MPGTEKTTVYLDSDAYARLKALAKTRGVAPASLVREAVAEYTVRHVAGRQPRCVGAFGSGRGDLSERDEELLAGMRRRR